MESTADAIQNATLKSDSDETKKKCLTNAEYNEIINCIDSFINDSTDCVLNKYGWLTEKMFSEYPHLHEDTVRSLIDIRVQHYVRIRHRRVFNTVSNTNSPSQSTAPTQMSDSIASNQSPINQKQHSRRLMSSANSIFERYKELVANSVASPLVTLANNLRMPAMLVAKNVLADMTREEKLKNQYDCQHSFNNDDSLNNISILNNSTDVFTDTYSLNNSSIVLAEDSVTNESFGTELDVSSSIDTQLSKQLNWLSSQLLSMRETPTEVLDESANSSTISSSHCEPTATKNVSLSTHQLATSTWMITSDPQLAYEVFKCSVIDGYYGPCVEFIKSCMGKRFEQLSKQRMRSITTDTKLLADSVDKKSLYTTEKECRVRGLDMTPDMLLNEPIAVFLTDDNSTCSEHYTAKNYVGRSDNGIRVLNWIESKAMFGAPEQLRTAMQRQLFPYWNRHGPGAVIYWFGYVLDGNETHSNFRADVSMVKPIDNCASPGSVKKRSSLNSTEMAAFNFWSKYCLLMDGFPAPSRIVMFNRWSLKKKI